MLAAEGEGPVSEGDGVVSLLFGFYATPPGGWGVLLGLERSHVVGCAASSLGDGALATGVGRVELVHQSLFEIVQPIVELLLRDGLRLLGNFLLFGDG